MTFDATRNFIKAIQISDHEPSYGHRACLWRRGYKYSSTSLVYIRSSSSVPVRNRHTIPLQVNHGRLPRDPMQSYTTHSPLAMPPSAYTYSASVMALTASQSYPRVSTIPVIAHGEPLVAKLTPPVRYFSSYPPSQRSSPHHLGVLPNSRSGNPEACQRGVL